MAKIDEYRLYKILDNDDLEEFIEAVDKDEINIFKTKLRSLTLLEACAGADYILIYLLKNGLDVNYINKEGESLLHLAAVNKNIITCALLIENGINVDHVNNHGFSALAKQCVMKDK